MNIVNENKRYKIIMANEINLDNIIRHSHQRFIITECFEPKGMGLLSNKKLV